MGFSGGTARGINAARVSEAMKQSRTRSGAPTVRSAGRRLSIIIPVSERFGPGVIAAFEETLVSVLENRPEKSEIIVVLGREYADPWNIREEVEFVRAPGNSSVVGCVNVGISTCSGDIVHVLAPGWRATPEWTEAPMSRFRRASVGAVAPVVVSEKDRSKIVAQGIAYRDGGQRLVVKPVRGSRGETTLREAFGPLLQAGFWRAELFDIAGPGFAAACGDAYADADLAVAAKAAGYETVVEPSSRVVEPTGRQATEGSFASGLHAERLFWRSAAGRPKLVPLASHLVEVVRHAVARAPFGTLPALAGRAAAMLQIGSYFARYRRLKAITAARGNAEPGDDAADNILRFDERHAAVPGPSRQPQQPLRRSA